MAKTTLENIAKIDRCGDQMKNFPIHSSRITIPWSVAEQAFLGYEKKYGKGQSLETIAKRGGFGAEEMDEFHPEWREHIRLKKENKQLKEQLRILGVRVK